MAKGFSQVQDVDYIQTFALSPASASVKFLADVANEYGPKIFHFDVAQGFVRAKLDLEIYMKLPDGCGDMSGRPQPIAVRSRADGSRPDYWRRQLRRVLIVCLGARG